MGKTSPRVPKAMNTARGRRPPPPPSIASSSRRTEGRGLCGGGGGCGLWAFPGENMGSNHFPFGPRYFRPDPVRARPNKLSRRLLDSRSSARHRRLHFSAGAAATATATATVPRAPEKAPRRIYVRWPPTRFVPWRCFSVRMFAMAAAAAAGVWRWRLVFATRARGVFVEMPMRVSRACTAALGHSSGKSPC